MILFSEVVHAEKMLEFYKQRVKDMNVFSVLFFDKPKREIYINAMNVLAIKGILKVSHTSTLLFKTVIILLLLYIRHRIALVAVIMSAFIVFKISMYMNGLINMYVMIASIIYVLLIIGGLHLLHYIYVVAKILGTRIIELEVNIDVGSESIEALKAADEGYHLVNDLTDEAIYRCFLLDEYQSHFKTNKKKLTEFIEKGGVKTLFESGGRHFQIAGLISITDLIYSSIEIMPDEMIAETYPRAIDLYDHPSMDITHNLGKILDNWINKSIYLIDDILLLPNEELFLLLMLCKDELLKQSEKYIVYDQM